MKILVISAFTFTFLYFLGMSPLTAQAKLKRYTAKVYTLNRRVISGVLESADEKGVYLTRRTGDTTTFVNSNQIKQIKLRRKGKASTGTTIGFLTGLAAGTGAVIALKNEDKLQNTLHVVGGVVFTFIATAVGGAISSQPDDVIQINGRSEDYLQVLQKLKSFTPVANR